MNRRSFLRSTATAAAIATSAPQLAEAAAPIAARQNAPGLMTYGDAELTRLGNDLRKAMADHVPIWRRWRDRHAALNREAHRRLTGSLDTPEGWAAYDALSREMGEEEASEANDRAVEAIDALCEQIHAIEPTTFAGLRAWYAVMLWHALDTWERELPPGALDSPRQVMLDFAADLDRLADVAHGAQA